MRVLVDSDGIIAVAVGDEDQQMDSAKVLGSVVRGEVNACATPLIMTNVMCALRRKWRTARPSTWKRDIALTMEGMLVDIAMIPVDASDFRSSFSDGFADQEDGIQYAAALRNGKVDAIVTCNVKDYRSGEIPVYEPGEFIEKHISRDPN